MVVPALTTCTGEGQLVSAFRKVEHVEQGSSYTYICNKRGIDDLNFDVNGPDPQVNCQPVDNGLHALNG